MDDLLTGWTTAYPGPLPIGSHDVYNINGFYVHRVNPTHFPTNWLPTNILQAHDAEEAFGCEVKAGVCHCEFYYYRVAMGFKMGLKMEAAPKPGQTAKLDHEGYCHILESRGPRKWSTIDDFFPRADLAHYEDAIDMFDAMSPRFTGSSPSSPMKDSPRHRVKKDSNEK